MDVRIKISPRFHNKFVEETSLGEKEGLSFSSSDIEIYVPLTSEERLRKENIVLKRLQAGLEDSRSEYLETEVSRLKQILQHDTNAYLCGHEYDNLLDCFEKNPKDSHEACEKVKGEFYACTARTMSIHYSDDEKEDEL